MKAWLIDQLTGIGGLHLDEVPDPVPGPGEVVLEVHYAALNPADRYLAERQYPARPALPHILGRDGMGTVVETGAGVLDLRRGDRRVILRGDVGGNRPGTFAQRVAVPVESLVTVPDGWQEPECAGATLVYLTAHQALTMWGPLPAKATVLVTGASGGVGVATVQLAAAMGCTVVALSRSGEKRERLLQLGASLTFNPESAEWWRAARDTLAPEGAALAVDSIGGRLLPEVVQLLGEGGRVSLVGRLAGPVPAFNTATLFFKRLKLGGVAVGAYTNAEARAAWDNVLSWLGRSRPVIDSVFPFEKLPLAFERLASGPMGKVLLRVKS